MYSTTSTRRDWHRDETLPLHRPATHIVSALSPPNLRQSKDSDGDPPDPPPQARPPSLGEEVAAILSVVHRRDDSSWRFSAIPDPNEITPPAPSASDDNPADMHMIPMDPALVQTLTPRGRRQRPTDSWGTSDRDRLLIPVDGRSPRRRGTPPKGKFLSKTEG